MHTVFFSVMIRLGSKHFSFINNCYCKPCIYIFISSNRMWMHAKEDELSWWFCISIYTHIRSLFTIIRIHLQLCNIRVWKCVFLKPLHFRPLFNYTNMLFEMPTLKRKECLEKKRSLLGFTSLQCTKHILLLFLQSVRSGLYFFSLRFLLSKYFVAESQPKWNKYLTRHQCNTDSNSCCELWRNEIILYSSDHTKSMASVFHMGMSIFFVLSFQCHPHS